MGFVSVGAIAAMLGVILGAFGAHGLRKRVEADAMAVYQTGVQYQLYHALAIIVIGEFLRATSNGLLFTAEWFLVIGIVIFSGSLYALALTGIKRWGMITPLGGLSFIIGWALLASAFVR